MEVRSCNAFTVTLQETRVKGKETLVHGDLILVCPSELDLAQHLLASTSLGWSRRSYALASPSSEDVTILLCVKRLKRYSRNNFERSLQKLIDSSSFLTISGLASLKNAKHGLQ